MTAQSEIHKNETGKTLWECLKQRGIIIAGAIALLSGILQIVSLSLLPESKLTTWLARGSLAIIFLAVAYILLCFLRVIINRALHASYVGIAEHVVKLMRQDGVEADYIDRDVDLAEQAFELASETYSIGYPLMDIAWTIRRNGSALVRRRISLKAFSTLKKVDTFLNSPDDLTDKIGFRSVSSETNGYLVKREIDVPGDGKNLVMLKISPALTEGRELTYLMFETLPKGLYAVNLTKEEIDERSDPVEYCGWSIQRPTKLLKLKVVFPPEFGIPKGFDTEVRYAVSTGLPGMRLNEKEHSRIGPPILSGPLINEDGEFYELSLKVEYPSPGLVYVLKWDPIPIA